MSLLTVAKNAGKFFGIKLGRTVPSFGNKLAAYEIDKSEFSINGNEIHFNKFNISLSGDNAIPMLEGYENALRLAERAGAKFSVSDDGNLLVTINNAKFSINDEEEMFILCEVFIEGAYNLLLPKDKKTALIDIGMNVGVTSIFYASQPQVEKVFSFEPFTPTFNMALKNLGLNSSFSNKLNPNNFGLAKEDGELQIPFSLKQKGRMGLKGIPEKSSVVKNDVALQTIFLKEVKTEFEKIKSAVKENYVVCKMDCEGAEYELIDSLYEHKLLSLPDVYFIEWHERSPDTIVEKLIAENYTVINTTFRVLHSGMIYAVKK